MKLKIILIIISTITTQDKFFQSTDSPNIEDTKNNSSPYISYIRYTNTTEKCTNKTCSITGYCYEEYTCRCIDGYASFNPETGSPGKDINGQYCTYKQKHKWTYFALEFICSGGVGHLFIGNYIIGYTKLVFTLLTYSVTIFLLVRRKKLNDCAKFFYNLFAVLLCVTMMIWQFSDAIMIGTNYYFDGNSVPLTEYKYES
jgi:hypothetical protein